MLASVQPSGGQAGSGPGLVATILASSRVPLPFAAAGRTTSTATTAAPTKAEQNRNRNALNRTFICALLESLAFPPDLHRCSFAALTCGLRRFALALWHRDERIGARSRSRGG